MSGPPPTPTHLKLLRGNPGHQKLNKDEPCPARPSEMPEPPAFFDGYACDEWWRVGPELHRLGLLTVLDLGPFEAYCEAYGRWRTAEEVLRKMAAEDPETGALLIRAGTGDPRANPLLSISTKAALNMLRFAGEFGLTPAARTRIRAGIAWRQGDGEFSGLLG